MFRLMVLVAVVVTVAPAGAQEKLPKREPFKLPPTEFPDIQVKPLVTKRLPDEPSKEQLEEFERARREYGKQFEPPAIPKVLDTDKPMVKLAKAKLIAASDAQERIRGRIDGGIFNSHEFVTFCDLGASLAATADLVFEKPADRLRWYEHRVLLAKMMELFYLGRTDAGVGEAGIGARGIDAPHQLPLASVARLDAEIALLKLKEQIGK